MSWLDELIFVVGKGSAKQTKVQIVYIELY